MKYNRVNISIESDSSYDKDIQILKLNKTNRKASKSDYILKYFILVFSIIILISIVIGYIKLYLFEKNVNNKFQKLDENTKKAISLANRSSNQIQNSLYNLSDTVEDFIKQYKQNIKQLSQSLSKFDLEKSVSDSIFNKKDFCLNPDKYYDEKTENLIIEANVHINEYYYKMFVYNNKQHFDWVSKGIIVSKNWEKGMSLQMIRAIQYYAKKII